MNRRAALQALRMQILTASDPVDPVNYKEAAEAALRDLEPYIEARAAEHDDPEDRESALAWASRAFRDVAITDADALGDVVIHLAERYHRWLKGADQ